MGPWGQKKQSSDVCPPPAVTSSASDPGIPSLPGSPSPPGSPCGPFAPARPEGQRFAALHSRKIYDDFGGNQGRFAEDSRENEKINKWLKPVRGKAQLMEHKIERQ